MRLGSIFNTAQLIMVTSPNSQVRQIKWASSQVVIYEESQKTEKYPSKSFVVQCSVQF